MRDLEGKTAFVTGGGSGIGRGIALALAAEGVRVAVGDIHVENARKVADELRAQGTEALGIAVDVTDPASLTAAAREAEATLGPVRILSNNAGIIRPPGPLTEQSQEDWDWIFSVNLFGIVKSVMAFLPQMQVTIAVDGGEGHIVNTASMAGIVTLPELQVGVYTASKYACTAYSEQLRGELAQEDIGVSVLCPGLIDTPIAANSGQSRPDKYGGPYEAAGGIPRKMRPMPPEAVGPIVVNGIRENLLHIVTHPRQSRALLQRRFEQLMADCKAGERIAEG